MPWENIGTAPGDDEMSGINQTLLTIWLECVLHPLPPGVRIGVYFVDHDYGSYPVIGVHWDDGAQHDAEKIASDALQLFEGFNEAVDWEQLQQLHDKTINKDKDTDY